MKTTIEEKLSYDVSMLEPIGQIFGRSVKKYGSKPKAVAWGSEERQLRRFQIFSGLFSLVPKGEGFSVNDLGCGYGAMFNAYKNTPEFSNAFYNGYDISAAMIEEARNQINDARAAWIHSHFATKDADFSFVSGTYNLNLGADNKIWQKYIEKNLCHLWSKTRVALGFNMLSTTAPNRKKTLYYGNPDHFLAFCMQNMDGKVQLIDRLFPNEFVIFIVRHQN